MDLVNESGMKLDWELKNRHASHMTINEAIAVIQVESNHEYYASATHIPWSRRESTLNL